MSQITGQPAYRQVAHDIRSKIADGTYPVGEAIPATKRLISLYQVSITVIRAAIRDLQNEGVLIGQPGKGVYVRRMPTAHEPTPLPDTYTRVVALEATVADLSAQISRHFAPDLADIRRQLAIMQDQIAELTRLMGTP